VRQPRASAQNPTEAVANILRGKFLAGPLTRIRSFRLPVIALLVIGLAALGPWVGAASPADPVWIEGVYDAGDNDELVELLTEAKVAIERLGQSSLPGLLTAAGHPPLHEEPLVLTVSFSTPRLRSPPAA
jgi:hypothetical protein